MVVIKGETDRADPMPLRPIRQRCFKLCVRVSELADEVERNTQHGMRQRDGSRVCDAVGNSGTALCQMQRSVEISDPEVEQVQSAQQLQLAERIAALLGDREPSVQ